MPSNMDSKTRHRLYIQGLDTVPLEIIVPVAGWGCASPTPCAPFWPSSALPWNPQRPEGLPVGDAHRTEDHQGDGRADGDPQLGRQVPMCSPR